MSLDFLFERRIVGLLICIIGGLSLLMTAGMALTADDLVFANGGLLGGDHVAFWTAARAALSDAWVSIYDPAVFEARLAAESEAGLDRFGLTWQYPPHAAALLAPFGLLPLPLSWIVWCAASVAAFAVALRRLTDTDWRTVALVCLSPVVIQVVITGQTGAWVGAALLGALLLPDRRPILAGVCAGLLTAKPQLGLLIPFAYLAGGHFRAIASAAATTGALVAVSVLWLGPEAWPAFADALRGVGQGVADAQYPLGKMVTVFAVLRSGGVPEGLALGVQGAAYLTAAALTVRVWRSAASPVARASITACLIFLTTPYAYYYDLAILALPFLYVLSRLEGPHPGRRAILYVLWMTPLWIVSLGAFGAFLGLAGVLTLTILSLRAAAPQTMLTLSPA